MPKPLFRPPRHLVKEWPEVFEDLYMNTMPLAYLELIHLEFADGRIWRIDFKENSENEDLDALADHLMSTMQEYKNDIVKLDFKIDIEKLKKDIVNSTQNLF
jgi:hypothetical protein